MIDITNDKFWESDYEIKKRTESRTMKFKSFIAEHKVISASIICLVICVITNVYLIYSFFHILKNLG